LTDARCWLSSIEDIRARSRGLLQGVEAGWTPGCAWPGQVRRECIRWGHRYRTDLSADDRMDTAKVGRLTRSLNRW